MCIQILKKGGNAFDAMIATDLALTVSYPFAGNIGGGGFMVYRSHDGKTGVLDYREKAPMAASRNMYLDANGNVIKGKSTLGAMAVGVLVTVAGLFKVYDKFGSLPFGELIQPAINLAKTFERIRETTHYSIVDKYGNAIAVTTTLNRVYGCKLYVSKGGFFLNNEMDDFSSKPDVPNQFGLVGAEANSIKPEKRMLSSMTPTIVEKNGKLYMVLGSPGGSTIITTVVQTFLNVYEFGMSMQQAVDLPRFHSQWLLPDDIKMEPGGFSLAVQDSLKQLGYAIDTTNAPVIGKVDAILCLPDGKLEGSADHRGDDKAVGY